MLDVICWKWEPIPGYRSTFLAEHVNTLRNMICRFLSVEHRFTCITDNPKGIDPDIRVIPLWDDFNGIKNPNVKGGPSCYRRLKAFSKEAKEIIGERILSIDLDCVIVGDITPLVDNDYDFICWGDTARNTHYNGGLWMLKSGTRTFVWDNFDPVLSPKLTSNKKIVGSDQAWISYCIEGKDPKWGKSDGVYSFRNDIMPFKTKTLPNNAKIVSFHGAFDPWDKKIMSNYSWVKKYYR